MDIKYGKITSNGFLEVSSGPKEGFKPIKSRGVDRVKLLRNAVVCRKYVETANHIVEIPVTSPLSDGEISLNKLKIALEYAAVRYKDMPIRVSIMEISKLKAYIDSGFERIPCWDKDGTRLIILTVEESNELLTLMINKLKHLFEGD